MFNLQEILLLVNYKEHKRELEENELLAWVKLLAYRKCFDKPTEDAASQSLRIKTLIYETIPIWENLNLNQFKLGSHDVIINDETALQLLKISFPSFEIGYQWLRNITQINFLRKDFDREGLSREHELKGLFPLKMIEEKCINLDEAKNLEKNALEYQLIDMTSKLHLLDHEPWPKNIKINNVVILGHVEQYIKECIDFIDDIEGNLFYLTGPRGLFNYEIESLSHILAIWFGLPEKVAIIRKVLEEHKNINDPLQCTMDLSLLKKKIMAALNVEKWPKAPQSYYYKDKKIFDAASVELKRERLDCLGGPWPVAMDMVDYYIKQRQKNHPHMFKKLNLIQVVTRGKNEKLPSIDDIIQTWYDKYGHELLQTDKNLIFVACSLTHRLPYVVNTLLNKISFMDALKRRSLNNKIDHFIHKKDIFSDELYVRVVGPPAKKLNIVLALDVLAKAIYSLDKNIKNLIREYELYKSLKKADLSPSPAIFALKIGHYNKYFNHLSLASSVFDLAKSFSEHPTKNLFYAAGLFNYAINVLKSAKEKNIDTLIKNLYECTLINMKSFIISALTRIHCADKVSGINWDILRKFDLENRSKLLEIRKKLHLQFNSLKNERDKEIYTLYENCLQERSHFLIELVQQCIQLLGKNPMQFEFAVFGSNARVQATPFSDWEYMMLIHKNDKNTMRYSLELTKLFLLKIINLGETYLPAFNILVKNKNGKEYNFSEILGYDKSTPVGYCLDADTEKASITPLGIKNNYGKRDRLIGTPDELMNMISHPNTFNRHDYFQQSLYLSRSIFFSEHKNENSLFKQYKILIKQHKDFNLSQYGLSLLKRDIEIFIDDLQYALKLDKITHEKYFYRPISAIIEDLYLLLHPVQNIDSHTKLILLEKYKIITSNDKKTLGAILKTILYFRFKMHDTMNRHEIHISKHSTLYKKVYLSLTTLRTLLFSFEERWIQHEIEILKREGRLAYNTERSNIQSKFHFFNRKAAILIAARKVSYPLFQQKYLK